MEAFVCEQLGLTPVPATQVVARDRHAEFLYAQPSASVESHRDPPPPADRGARGRGAVPRGHPEGLERDAAQAQPVALRTAVRTARPAGQSPGRPRRHRPLARAGHLAFVGRTHRARRLGAARLLHARAVRKNRRGDARVSRPHAREPRLVVRARVQPAGVARAGRRRGTRDDAYRIVQRAATRTWEERRPFRTVLAEDPEVLATLSPDRLDECFELRRASLTPVARWTPWTSRRRVRDGHLACTCIPGRSAISTWTTTAC